MTPLNVNKMCGTSRRVAKWRTKNCCQLARPTTWITLAAANGFGQLPTRKRKTWNAIGIWEWGCGWGWQCCEGFASHLQMVYFPSLSLSLFLFSAIDSCIRLLWEIWQADLWNCWQIDGLIKVERHVKKFQEMAQGIRKRKWGDGWKANESKGKLYLYL